MSLHLCLVFLEVSYGFLCPIVLVPLQRIDEIYCLVGIDIITNEEDQNMPPENMSLWHKDYFELKEIEKQQTQEELPLSALKAGHKCPFVKVT